MKKRNSDREMNDMNQLCGLVRAYVIDGAYELCKEHICQAIMNYPQAPQPYNLLGIVMEKSGDHLAAMKLFRAAWAIDPTYLPANHNLTTYGTFFSDGRCAYDESDLAPAKGSDTEIVYNKRKIGHMVRKNKIEYDEHGIGHVVRR